MAYDDDQQYRSTKRWSEESDIELGMNIGWLFEPES